eukprot:GHVT01022192.1.p3 GENE.GHVT01022192.1~~GHVT01022192.1.p3  ORF type:complete len:147 (-),score=15.25 GHVT01022192.1:2010-2450(-)
MDAIQDFLLVPAAFFVMAFATHQFFVWRGLTKSFLLPLRRHWVVELHQVLRGDALIVQVPINQALQEALVPRTQRLGGALGDLAPAFRRSFPRFTPSSSLRDGLGPHVAVPPFGSQPYIRGEMTTGSFVASGYWTSDKPAVPKRFA